MVFEWQAGLWRRVIDSAGRMPHALLLAGPAGGGKRAFAETLASWSAAHVVDPAKYHCVGQEINANHVRAVTGGWVYGEARPLHLGRTTHVWEVRITNEEGKLVCISRMTAAVLSKPSEYK